MTNLWKSVLGLCVIGMGLGVSAPAQAASANGPYYATPSWDQTLPAATRFIVLTNMASQAVLDRETGLVWEQSPSTFTYTWFEASDHCVALSLGGRSGWRLPTIQELASLIDPTQSPPLPSGHPFNAEWGVYWSATTRASNADDAWGVTFFGAGFVSGTFKDIDGWNSAWCVRGGQGVDVQ